MAIDLREELMQDYKIARDRDDRLMMTDIAYALSFLASGQRDEAEAVMFYQRGWNDAAFGRPASCNHIEYHRGYREFKARRS
ncbi:hypothetical protein [Burkholderia gladioli]|uniref:hypothetical protein n=1 Tax=Burkholderia gladioli TaxID=28095 RepID=UPI0016411FAB|nr:hypothetical protein [Burkholderia gladioli]